MSYFDGAQVIFDDRYNEIQEFINLGKSLVSNKASLNDIAIVFDRIHEHSFKANIILMQYNLLESVFLELYKEFYSVLRNCNKNLDDLPEKFAYTFFMHTRRMSNKKDIVFYEKLFDANNGLNFSKSLFQTGFTLNDEEKKFLVNGNLDARKIKDFLINWGIDLNTLNDRIISPLKTLKDQRQLLAHGGMSFVEVGNDLTWESIDEYNQALEYIFRESKTLLADHLQRFV